jgi:hypothetical protein
MILNSSHPPPATLATAPSVLVAPAFHTRSGKRNSFSFFNMAKGRENYLAFCCLLVAVGFFVGAVICIIVGGALLGVGIGNQTQGLIIAGGVILGLSLLCFVGGCIGCKNAK